MNPLDLLAVFLKACGLTLTGLGALPVLQQELVQVRGWATDAQIAKSLAVSRLSPGPTGMYVVSLGYMLMGWLGALLALLAATLPPLVLVPAAPLLRRTMHRPWVSGLMRGLALSSAGLLLAVGAGLVFPSGFNVAQVKLWHLGLAGLALGLTRQGQTHPAIILGLAGAAGLAFTTLGW